MNIDVRGKRVVIAGGSRGIGRSIALAFAAAGAHVSICARGAQALEATRDELAAFGAVLKQLNRGVIELALTKAYATPVTADDLMRVARRYVRPLGRSRDRAIHTAGAKRLGHPEEVANVVLFLASPLAGWVTAQIIGANGGQGFAK